MSERTGWILMAICFGISALCGVAKIILICLRYE